MKKENFLVTKIVKNKTIIIVVLLTLLFSAGIVTFAQPLAENIFGVKSATSGWDIAFTKAVTSEIKGNAREVKKVSYTADSATFAVELTGVGDSITYDFTVTNRSNVDAKVESIYMVPTNKEDDAILFYTSNLVAGDELLSGESKELRVKAEFNPSFGEAPSKLEKKVTIYLSFVQK